MNEIPKLGGSAFKVFPEYQLYESLYRREQEEGGGFEYIIGFSTFIRKQKNGIWYLIPIRLHEAIVFVNYEEYSSKKGVLLDSVVRQGVDLAFRTYLFYIIEPDTIEFRHGQPSPTIYIHEDQRSEEERLIPKV